MRALGGLSSITTAVRPSPAGRAGSRWARHQPDSPSKRKTASSRRVGLVIVSTLLLCATVLAIRKGELANGEPTEPGIVHRKDLQGGAFQEPTHPPPPPPGAAHFGVGFSVARIETAPVGGLFGGAAGLTVSSATHATGEGPAAAAPPVARSGEADAGPAGSTSEVPAGADTEATHAAPSGAARGSIAGVEGLASGWPPLTATAQTPAQTPAAPGAGEPALAAAGAGEPPLAGTGVGSSLPVLDATHASTAHAHAGPDAAGAAAETQPPPAAAAGSTETTAHNHDPALADGPDAWWRSTSDISLNISKGQHASRVLDDLLSAADEDAPPLEDCKIYVLDAAQEMGPAMGVPTCDLSDPQTWPFGLPGRGIDGAEALPPQDSQYSSEYWISRAIRNSTRLTRDAARADIVFVDLWCPHLSWLAWHHPHFERQPGSPDPGAFVRRVLSALVTAPRFVASRGAAYAIADPAPALAGLVSPDERCDELAGPLHLVPERDSLCPWSRADADVPGRAALLPYAASTDLPVRTPAEQLAAPRPTLIYFQGGCGDPAERHLYAAGKMLRYELVKQLREDAQAAVGEPSARQAVGSVLTAGGGSASELAGTAPTAGGGSADEGIGPGGGGGASGTVGMGEAAEASGALGGRLLRQLDPGGSGETIPGPPAAATAAASNSHTTASIYAQCACDVCADHVLHEKVVAGMAASSFCPIVSSNVQSSRRLSEAFLAGCIPVFIGAPWHTLPFERYVDYAAAAFFIEISDDSAWVDEKEIRWVANREAADAWALPAALREHVVRLPTLADLVPYLKSLAPGLVDSKRLAVARDALKFYYPPAPHWAELPGDGSGGTTGSGAGDLVVRELCAAGARAKRVQDEARQTAAVEAGDARSAADAAARAAAAAAAKAAAARHEAAERAAEAARSRAAAARTAVAAVRRQSNDEMVQAAETLAEVSRKAVREQGAANIVVADAEVDENGQVIDRAPSEDDDDDDDLEGVAEGGVGGAADAALQDNPGAGREAGAGAMRGIAR